jgi:NAD(P)H dehydrogenase (quinone)
MDFLIIYAHPNPKSFNHAIKETIEEKIKEKGKSFETRDLYSLNFDPVMKPADFIAIQKGEYLPDVKKEQDLIKEAKTVIFVHPIWWYSMPSILKGYIDRVFSYGFAYVQTEEGIKPLLTDKKVIIFNTLGETKDQCEGTGICQCLHKTIGGTFEFCGMEVLRHEMFFAVPYVSDEKRKEYLKEVEKVMEEIL